MVNNAVGSLFFGFILFVLFLLHLSGILDFIGSDVILGVSMVGIVVLVGVAAYLRLKLKKGTSNYLIKGR